MSGGGHKMWHNTDDLIPEPALFARQLGWTKGFGPAWSWKRLADVAGELYWQRRTAPRQVEDVAA